MNKYTNTQNRTSLAVISHLTGSGVGGSVCIRSDNFMRIDYTTPHLLLSSIQKHFSDRAVVLPSAWKSIKRLVTFRYLEELSTMLVQLVTTYVDSLRYGKGDAEARSVFGKAYAAKEAKTLHKSGRERRTFDYNGSWVFMERHLKIGTNKDSPSETARVHFHWDAQSQRVIIGWCGPHLPLS